MKVKEMIRSLNAKAMGVSATVAAALTPVMAHAASFNSYSGTDGNKIVEGVKKLFGTIGTWGGAIWLISAVFALILSIRNEDTEGRNKCILNILAAIALLSTTGIINLFF